MSKRQSLPRSITSYPLVKFGDVVRNANLSEKDPLGAGIERIVGLEHIDPENLHIRRWNTPEEGTSFTRKFVSGQTLFGKRRAYQRKVDFAEFEGICSGDILTFEPKDPKVLLPELLPFICQTDSFFEHALGTSAGSLSPRTSWKALKDFQFPLPPLDEQRRIAEILRAADEAVEKYWNLGEALTMFKEATISKYMPIDVSFGELRKGLIPGVKCSKLRDLCTKITDGTHQPPTFSKEGTPFLLISNIRDGQIDWNVSKHISKETYRQLTKTTKPERGDILYTVVASYGDAVLIDWDRPFSFQRHIGIIKPKRDILDGKYLCYFLKSVLGRKQAEIYAEGLAQKTITLKSLGQFVIPVPPLDTQVQICCELDGVEDLIKKNHIAISSCREMTMKARNSLISGGAHV